MNFIASRKWSDTALLHSHSSLQWQATTVTIQLEAPGTDIHIMLTSLATQLCQLVLCRILRKIQGSTKKMFLVRHSYSNMTSAPTTQVRSMAKVLRFHNNSSWEFLVLEPQFGLAACNTRNEPVPVLSLLDHYQKGSSTLLGILNGFLTIYMCCRDQTLILCSSTTFV